MGKIFKNMIPYWKPLILVLLLLFVQAWCDLSLPAYTSDIIDVGIQNQGIKHILPEALTPEEYEKAELLMTDEETASWEESYALNGSVYERNVTGEERLEELDDTFLVPLLMNYQMSAMEESTFKKLMAEQMHTDESALDGMTIEQIGASMGVELKTFEKETQNEDGNTTTVRRWYPAACWKKSSFYQCAGNSTRCSMPWAVRLSNRWAWRTRQAAMRRQAWMWKQFRSLICGKPV